MATEPRSGTSVSSVTARSAASWPRTCTRAATSRLGAYDVKLGTTQEAPLREHAARHGVDARRLARRARRRRRISSSRRSPRSQTVRRRAGAAPPPSARAPGSSTSIRRRPARSSRPRALIDGAGGRYVEGAVMTSIPPHRIRVPLLLGGPRRGDARARCSRPGLRRPGRLGHARRRVGHQDVPQRDDQGARGDGRRELRRRARLWRRRLRCSPRWPRPSPASTGSGRARTSSSA